MNARLFSARPFALEQLGNNFPNSTFDESVTRKPRSHAPARERFLCRSAACSTFDREVNTGPFASLVHWANGIMFPTIVPAD